MTLHFAFIDKSKSFINLSVLPWWFVVNSDIISKLLSIFEYFFLSKSDSKSYPTFIIFKYSNLFLIIPNIFFWVLISIIC